MIFFFFNAVVQFFSNADKYNLFNHFLIHRCTSQTLSCITADPGDNWQRLSLINSLVQLPKIEANEIPLIPLERNSSACWKEPQQQFQRCER